MTNTKADELERERFEYWYLRRFCGAQYNLKRSPHHDFYMYSHADNLWACWQARAQLEKE